MAEHGLDDPSEWLAALRAAYARGLDDGMQHWNQAKAAVESGAASGEALAEAAMQALETMGPDDGISLGMSACRVLREHGGEAVLERLRAVRPSLPARTAIRDWRLEAGRALAVVEARAAGKCTCEAEAGRGAPVADEQFEIESKEVDDQRWCVVMQVRCTRCDTRYRVERDDSYHYPSFYWRGV